jgi:hypothetical protein
VVDVELSLGRDVLIFALLIGSMILVIWGLAATRGSSR